MDWIREWVMQITGVILICSVCDIIVAEGTMKKYIKPILGFVLIVVFLRPFIGVINNELKIECSKFDFTDKETFALKLEKTQDQAIKNLYESKLADKIATELKSVYPGEAKVKVVASSLPECFGNIERIEINIEDICTADSTEISNYICKIFNVSDDKVVIMG